MKTLRAWNVSSSTAMSVLQGGVGLFATDIGPRPEERLKLYEFEGCPFCRKVREALTMMDLEAEIYPCPKGGTRFRAVVEAEPGPTRFPFLVDPNTDARLFESRAILEHLYRHYGTGSPPVYLRADRLTTLRSMVASVPRAMAGIRVRASREPEQPLELWSFEASPYCRLVREALCELEIPYVLHNVGKRSPSRREFVAKSEKMMVPWLVDPNTGAELFESADIVRYLNDTYAV